MMSNKILVAIDGSDHAWKALDLAAEIAKQRGARLIVLHVVPYEPMPEALRAFAEAEHIPLEEEAGRHHSAQAMGDHLTRTAEARARGQGLSDVTGRTVEGKPADQILEEAAGEDVEMIVMGSRGLSDARALFLGSVSHKVANHAGCTCVTVK
jgi:nucleotide-binding universal stress UspA family protein